MKRFLLLPSLALMALLSFAAAANPGAHGPNGEHLDAPTASVAGAADATPRMETFSELFELVARLQGHSLSVLVNRYESNVPVLSGTLEVESGETKAKAAFDAESGAFVVADEKLIELLSKPGQHPLVFTIAEGEDIDLLTGELVVGAAGAAGSDDHDHGGGWGRWLLIVLVLVALAAAALWIRRRRSRA